MNEAKLKITVELSGNMLRYFNTLFGTAVGLTEDELAGNLLRKSIGYEYGKLMRETKEEK